MGSLQRKLQRKAARQSGEQTSVSPSLSRRLELFGHPLFVSIQAPGDRGWLAGTASILKMLWNRGGLPALDGDKDRRDMREFVELMLFGANQAEPDPTMTGEAYEQAKDRYAELLVQMLETRRTVFKDDARKVGTCTIERRAGRWMVAASEAAADAG